ncbi:MAG TPA: hypothetical protein VEF34_03630 [Syntrophobacteraceae bacterium]|nr:hypothetical protein [Syntrophobacteraceae bacterium]
MSWLVHHSQSEIHASEAEVALKQGHRERAADLYRLAAVEETKAVSGIDPGAKARTFGITSVSAASLWFKANELEHAQRLALKWLNSQGLPDFAFDQLRTILQTIWNEMSYRKAGIEFVKGEVLVSIDGGEVVSGGAPLDLVNRKVSEVSSFFYRTIEWELKQPFRKRGLPSQEIQEQFRPYLFQAPAGSYQFAVRVQKPKQLSMFADRLPRIEQITERFFEVIRATCDPSLELKSIVPDNRYRDSFLKLARNFAPSGQSFRRVEIRTASGTITPVVLVPESRAVINDVLKKAREPKEPSEHKIDMVIGILRGLHLDQDWLEISLPGGTPGTLKIYEAGDVIDDIVGPMVNHRVSVEVAIRKDGRHLFQDIQPVE